jgi:hypothetical protein
MRVRLDNKNPPSRIHGNANGRNDVRLGGKEANIQSRIPNGRRFDFSAQSRKDQQVERAISGSKRSRHAGIIRQQ